MALFACWHEEAVRFGPPSLLHAQLLAEAHVVPDQTYALDIATANGLWHVSAFATDTHFYRAHEQVWSNDQGEACIIHGVIWRQRDGRPTLLTAADVAHLLERPGQIFPDDIAGEYAVARLHSCGTLTVFSDAAGLHQLFHRSDRNGMAGSRAAFLALLAQDWTTAPVSGLWLSTVGYRVGEVTGWRNVEQIPGGLVLERASKRLIPPSRRLPPPSVPRGFDTAGSESLLERGLEEARAATLLGAGDGLIDLPITGGKDSRAVLALCLAAGLRDRLHLFTRGPEGHPDVEAGRLIAQRIGLPHRRESPPDQRGRSDWDAEMLRSNLAQLVYQTDGGMGGWDLISGTSTGTATLMTGHMGEVLKAYAKVDGGNGGLSPAAIIRLQGPFDPLGLLRDEARAAMIEQVEAQMAVARAEGAEEADLPDLFYLQNRIPNWLGGIRGIKSFERQPIMPLGVPGLQALAFRLTAEERKQELLHYAIVRRLAPELLDLPFAHQSWNTALPEAPLTPPLLATASSPLFGNWQYSINADPALRDFLGQLFRATDAALWDALDRDRLLAALRDTCFDYFGLISLLGLTAALFHEARLVEPDKLAPPGTSPKERASTSALRPIAAVMGRPPSHEPLELSIAGHLDAVAGAASSPAPGKIRTQSSGMASLSGWLFVPECPGAQPMVRAHVGPRTLAASHAGAFRKDLLDAGIGHGAYGFTLTFDVADVQPGDLIEISSIDDSLAFEGARLEVERDA